MSVLSVGLLLFICLAITEAAGKWDNLSEHTFVGVVCLLAGLLALVWVWSNRNLDSAGWDRELHRTLGFHFMARGDYKQAALQFIAVLRLQTNSPEARDTPTTLPTPLQPFALAQQSIARVATTEDSNLVGFLNESLARPANHRNKAGS